jgi:CheY-like chemotaxis protein
MQILLAEDNAINALYVSELLQEFGCKVKTVGNGREAITAWEAGGIDLILMDVQMPGLDGVTAMKSIREREGAGKRIPIVALTAYALRSEQAELLSAGFDGYVAKPFVPEDLLLALQRFSNDGPN